MTQSAYNPFMQAALDQGFAATLATALAPKPFAITDPIRAAWDAALAEYLRLLTLLEADNSLGAFYNANHSWESLKNHFAGKYGKDFANHPEAQERWETETEAYSSAENAFCENFERPLWDAERRLCAAPVPDMQAALFKLELVRRNRLQEDTAIAGPAMASLTADLARLAGGQA